MKNRILFALLLCGATLSAQEKIEFLPFGNMDKWAVRYIKESGLLGGETRALYVVGPVDTIRGNQPYPYGKGGSPWGTSNAYAKVMGVDKAAVSVTPEKRGNGYCARLETVMQNVKAIGIDLKALATGSLFTGKLLDPITMDGSKNPAKAIDMGTPFTKRPKAFMLDFKATILPTNELQSANASTKIKTMPGHDEGEILVILQHRWEEADGRILAYRVGTAIERITKNTNGWQNDYRMPIRYGDISADAKPYQLLTTTRFMARNSKGKMVPVEEVGFSNEVEPTHLIIQIASGCQAPYVGCPGNVVWCDNLRFVY